MKPPTNTHKMSPERTWKWALRLFSLAVFVSSWEVMARLHHSLLFPAFSETAAAMVTLLFSAEVWHALWLSNQALLAGYLCAIAVGVPIGLLLGRLPGFGRFADPYLMILLTTPKSALIPLIVLAAGLGIYSRILAVFSFTVVSVIINTEAGIRQIDPSLIEMARSFQASERQLWTKVLLPAARPAIAGGLYLGLGRAISGMINVELLLVAVGIGRLILQFQANFESAKVYAVVLIVMGEAFLLMSSVKRLIRPMGLSKNEVAIR